jgi:RimJ/RimL family protein N-acetyltransferase
MHAMIGDLFETERLRLERWDPARDTDALVEMNADAEVMRHIGDGRPGTRAESELQSRSIASHWERFGFGLWAVRLAADEPAVGFAGLAHPLWFPSERSMVEVGWRLRRDAWGRGIATEAGRAGLDVGFGVLALERIVSYILPGNARSQAVSRRLGMELARVVAHPRRRDPVQVWELRAGPAAADRA